MRRDYTPEERLDRACLRVAMVIRGMWEEKGFSDTRLLEPPLLPDELTIVGKSLAYDGKGHREHVVPRRVIINECHERIKNGQTDEQIAQFIRETTKIVLITKEECARLDRAANFRLKQKMPDDWKIDGDIFARLVAAEIKWEPIHKDELREL
jgi:hypothetical protein